jgi:hypothetical protein
MTATPNYFADFVSEIRLKGQLEKDCSQKHLELRRLLQADSELAAITVDAFLQGSYRRSTGVRPLDPEDHNEHVDVDLVLVTTLDPEAYTPEQVVGRFTPFLDRSFRGRWSPNDRSVKITYPETPVSLDLVVTAAPSMVVREALRKAAEASPVQRSGGFLLSERGPDLGDILSMREAGARMRKAAGAQDWRDEVLLIPDRQLRNWVETHPVEQIVWTEAKNTRTATHYVNVVKAMKWWRRRHDDPEYPKGYPLEHLVGVVCPDGIGTIAEGLALSLEAIVNNYGPHVQTGTKPVLPDHGVPEHDVFRRVTAGDFAGFYRLVQAAADLARRALDAPTLAESTTLWRELLGPEFPEPPDGSFAERVAASTIATTGRFG